MSPTSYQTAPPRISIITTAEWAVKRAFLLEARRSARIDFGYLLLVADGDNDSTASGAPESQHSFLDFIS